MSRASSAYRRWMQGTFHGTDVSLSGCFWLVVTAKGREDAYAFRDEDEPFMQSKKVPPRLVALLKRARFPSPYFRSEVFK